MLKKIVSYLGENPNRLRRENEVPGWDYFFVSPKKLLKKKENGELLQFFTFSGTHYGYPYSQFLNIDSLVIICGGSGSGKDSIMNELCSSTKDESDKTVGFLFAFPETVPLFVEYAESMHIPYKILNFIVEEDERLKRIIAGGLSSLPELEKSKIDVVVKKISDSFRIDVFKDSKEVDYSGPILEVINIASLRVIRDREKPLDEGITWLEKEKGYVVSKINLTKLDFPSACNTILMEMM